MSNIVPLFTLAANVEQILQEFLQTNLSAYGYPGIKIQTELPEQRGTKVKTFIRLVLLPGRRTSVNTHRESVLVECWSSDKAEARSLARMVEGLVQEMPRILPSVQNVDGSTPYFDPDPDTDTPRYTQTIDIWTRAITLRKENQ